MQKIIKGLVILLALGALFATTGCTKESEFKRIKTKQFKIKMKVFDIQAEKEVKKGVAEFKDLKECEQDKAIEKEKEKVRKLKKLYKEYKDGAIDDKEIRNKVREIDKFVSI